MAKPSSKKQHTLQPNIDNFNSAELESIEDKPIRYIIAGIIVGVYAAIYNLQDLFNANDLNDFSEYYLRAEDWAKGSFNIGGGSDILLSAVEYFGILVHPHDFLASYYLAANILTALVMTGCFLFIVKKNPALPDFWTKLALVAITLSIPHFVFATVTIDQTLLFAACLFFFLSTYNLKWAGLVSVFVFFSRPEAIIIIPMYALLYYVDTDRRKDILLNAATFIAGLIGLKLYLSSYAPTTTGGGGYQEYGFVSKLSLTYMGGLLQHISRIPAVLVTYAYECFQNMWLFILFLAGFVASIRQRHAWAMYGVLVAFLMSYAVLYADASPESYSTYTNVIRSMSKEKEYFIVNAFNKFDKAIGHGRYRLVLYPAFAFFVAQGLALLLGFAINVFAKATGSERRRHITFGASGLVGIFMILRMGVVTKEHDAATKLDKLHPVYKMGLELRKQKADGTIFIDNFCDASQGSFLIEFASYSGIRKVLTRFCDQSPIWASDTLGNRRVLLTAEYKQQMPQNPTLLAEFNTATASMKQLYDTSAIGRWERTAFQYDANQMGKDKISHVIAARKILLPHLSVIDSVGGAFIHRVRL